MATSSFFDYAKSSNFPDYSGSIRSTPSFDVGKAYTGGYGDLTPKTSSWDKWGPTALNFAKEFAAGLGSRYGDREDSRNRYPFMGQGTPGWGGQLLDNLAYIQPPQRGIEYFPGQEGKKSIWGDIAGVGVGALTSMIPGVGPVLAPMAASATSSLIG